MLVCGVDIGTTNLKVALVDGSGRTLWLRSVSTPRRCAAKGSVDGREIVGLIERLIVEGWTATGCAHPLAAICTTGVGEDGVYVDKGLKPLSPVVPWFDRSAAPQAEWIRASAAWTPRTGIEMEPTRTGARWRWYREHFPQVLAHAQHWIALTDLPSVIWTGQAFMSQTLAARTGCYDVVARAWIDDLLDVCGSPMLPPVLCAGDVVGQVFAPGLLSSGVADRQTLIVAGGHDHPVAASFIQRIEPRARVDSIGTANVVYGQTPRATVGALEPGIAFTVPLQAASGLACLGVFEFSTAVQALERRGIDIKRFLALPRMPGAPGDADEPRQVFERAAFSAHQMLARMARAGVPDGPLFATGGWSRSQSLVALRASIFGETVHVLHEQEPAVVGAALLGAGSQVELNRQARAISSVEPDAEWMERYATDQTFMSDLHIRKFYGSDELCA